MSISSGAPGMRVETAAKESAGAAATLGSPATSASDNVIVPDAMSANNEGNVESSPVYPGRMFCLRPWEMKLVSAVVADGGSGYSVGDVLELGTGVSPIEGVAGPGGRPEVTVATVDDSGSPIGVVLTVTISTEASFATRRETMTGAPSPPDNPVSTLSLSSPQGSGCTLTQTYAPHFELRFILGDVSNTLTVNEDWIVPPESGDAWAVGYTLDDVATVNGLTLRAQSGVFEASRRLFIGFDPSTERHGWLAMNDGKALELDNAADNSMALTDAAVWTCGYLQAGIPINGAYLSTSNTTGASEVNISFESLGGSIFFLFDLQVRSPREQIEFSAIAFDTIDVAAKDFRNWVGAILQNTKWFKVGNPFSLDAFKVRDAVFQNDNDTFFNLILALDGGNSGESLVNLDRVILLGLKESSAGGIAGRRTDFSAAVLYDKLRNINFIDAEQFVLLNINETFEFVNPIWEPDLSANNDFEFVLTGSPPNSGTIKELMSLVLRIVDTAGDGISGVHGYIYEGVVGDDLPVDNTNQSDTGAVDDPRFIEKFGGVVAYVTDVLNNVYTTEPTSSPQSVDQALRGGFAFRGYFYGNIPLSVPFAVDLNGGLELQSTMLVDPAITKSTQSAALTLSPAPVVTRHDSDVIFPSPQVFTDSQKMKVFNYDGGNGNIPPNGQTITSGASPEAVGVVADHFGNGILGTLLLESWNGVEFSNNDTLTGTGPAPLLSAFVNREQSPEFYEEVTWLVDGQNQIREDIYDYLAARMAEDPVTDEFEKVIVWGGNEATATQLLFSGSGGYFTRRAVGGNDVDDFVQTLVFTDAFNRSPNEDPLTGGGSPRNWLPIGSNDQWVLLANAHAEPDSLGSGEVQYSIVNPDVVTLTDDQFVIADLLNVGGDTRWDRGIGLRCTDDGASPGGLNGYAFLYHIPTGTSESPLEKRLRIVRLDGVTAGSSQEIGLANDVFVLSDITDHTMQFFAFGSTLVGRVIDSGGALVQEIIAFDTTYTGGGVALVQQDRRLGTEFEVDEFRAGDLSADGEGVWISNRGAGAYDFFTTDSGQIFTIPATVTLRIEVTDEAGDPIQGVLAGMFALENVGDVGIGDELMTGTKAIASPQSYGILTNSQGIAENTNFNFQGLLDASVRARKSSPGVAFVGAPTGAFDVDFDTLDDTIQAIRFTMPADAISAVAASMAFNETTTSGAHSFRAYLYKQNSPAGNGDLIAVSEVFSDVQTGGAAVYRLPFTTNPVLVPGDEYWLAATVEFPGGAGVAQMRKSFIFAVSPEPGWLQGITSPQPFFTPPDPWDPTPSTGRPAYELEYISSTNIRYEPFRQQAEISASGLTVFITLREDPNATDED